MNKKEIFFKESSIKLKFVNSFQEIKKFIYEILDNSNLPKDKNCTIFIKPNLNNDLNALTGNSSDLRIISSVVEYLKTKEYKNIIIADGSNVGIDRRKIDVFKRLRIDKLAKFYDVKIFNLNLDKFLPYKFKTGNINLSQLALRADFFINIPKMKTHAEAVMSLAVKSLMGCVVSQDKRKMHLNLPENLIKINEIIKPNLYIVDSLILMEGNGPGDGEPKEVNLIASGTNPFLIDLLFSKLFGFDWSKIKYLQIAYKKGYITDDDLKIVSEIELVDNIKKAPKRSFLAELSEKRSLYWLKLMVRPILDFQLVKDTAYRLKIIQDIYIKEDDDIKKILLDSTKCENCDKCKFYCPIDFEKIRLESNSVLSNSNFCIRCLYCYFICPKNAIILEGSLGFLKNHIDKYKPYIIKN